MGFVPEIPNLSMWVLLWTNQLHNTVVVDNLSSGRVVVVVGCRWSWLKLKNWKVWLICSINLFIQKYLLKFQLYARCGLSYINRDKMLCYNGTHILNRDCLTIYLPHNQFLPTYPLSRPINFKFLLVNALSISYYSLRLNIHQFWNKYRN